MAKIKVALCKDAVEAAVAEADYKRNGGKAMRLPVTGGAILSVEHFEELNGVNQLISLWDISSPRLVVIGY